MNKFIVGLSLMAAGLLISACSKSSIVGSEILDDDYVNVVYSDSTTLKIINLKADSVRSFPLSAQMFLLGHINDPIFGETSSEMYTQIRKMFEVPNLENSVLDSVVLSLSTNPVGKWGDSIADHMIKVYELGESINDLDTIYSSQGFQKGMLLGSRAYRPIASDTASLIIGQDTFAFNNIFRIPLDLSFGEKLFNDTLALNNDTLLLELTNGLVIESETDGNSVFGINSGQFLDDYTNKIIFYYTHNDSISASHSLTIGGKRSVHYEHNYSNSMVKDFFNDEELSDSLIFMAGMQNTQASIEIPHLNGLENTLINYAEIEFYAAELDDGLPFDKIQQFYLFNQNEDGSLTYIEDLNISIISGTISYFDASLTEELDTDTGIVLNKYNINFTNELKSRIQAGNTNTKMILRPYLSQSNAHRSVLFGPGHSQYPAKLKITYTKQ